MSSKDDESLRSGSQAWIPCVINLTDRLICLHFTILIFFPATQGDRWTNSAFSYICRTLNNSIQLYQQKVNVTHWVLTNLVVFSEICDCGRRKGNKHSFHMTEIKYLSSVQFWITLDRCKETCW